ncbi:flavodoxin domain-containing protein [Candidatus Roizmanbacteria bacterium]|nr:MAG: flavodoxin domain-containing protein [Candidatus Roizmanbacteria bacterium]
MNIAIAYASMYGTTTSVAQELKQYLKQKNIAVDLLDVMETNPDNLTSYDLIFFGVSTYGDGELNPVAEDFFAKTKEIAHTCNHTKFAIFALGDKAYPQFAKSGELTQEILESMNAQVITPILTIEASPFDEAIRKTKTWADEIISQVTPI